MHYGRTHSDSLRPTIPANPTPEPIAVGALGLFLVENVGNLVDLLEIAGRQLRFFPFECF